MKKFLLSIYVSFLLIIAYGAWASTTASRQYNFVDDKNNAVPITASRMDAEFDNDITKLNQKVIIAASAPSSPIAGMLWYDSTNKLLKEYRNSEWIVRATIHGATARMATAQRGDMWVNWQSIDALKSSLQANNGSSWFNIIPEGINWSAVGAQITVNTAAINWSSLVNNVNYTGINWKSIPGDASGNFLRSNGDNTVNWSSNSGIQVFTASGTFIAPSGVTRIYVTIAGSGGGGGGGAGGSGGAEHNTAGSGGGSGAKMIDFPYTVTPGNSYTVTVNDPGTGGSGAGDGAASDGTDGGSVSFDSVLTCPGGSKGLGGDNIDRTGGAGGAINSTSVTSTPGGACGIAGSSGGNSIAAGASPGARTGGGGGGGILGIGGSPGSGNLSNGSAPTQGFGGGGGGGGGYRGGTGGTGGAGAKGVVIIRY